MEIAVLIFLAAALIVTALVYRGRGGASRSWDHTDAWDALKRVGKETSGDAQAHKSSRHIP
jgi:hypothetical protein